MITEAHRAAWASIPVDDVGYLPGASLLSLGDAELAALVGRVRAARYGGWRNDGGRWTAVMRLDEAAGLRVLDYGCGLGVEALEYARAGALVSLADINQSSVDIATRVLALEGFAPEYRVTLAGSLPDLPPGLPRFDVVHMSGVLHHIQDPVPAVMDIAGALRPGGELRVMVYSDRGWRDITSTDPPQDVAGHPECMRFVRHFDQVGDWADWYDAARLESRFGRWLDVTDVRYITPSGHYLTATLRKPG